MLHINSLEEGQGDALQEGDLQFGDVGFLSVHHLEWRAAMLLLHVTLAEELLVNQLLQSHGLL